MPESGALVLSFCTLLKTAHRDPGRLCEASCPWSQSDKNIAGRPESWEPRRLGRCPLGRPGALWARPSGLVGSDREAQPGAGLEAGRQRRWLHLKPLVSGPQGWVRSPEHPATICHMTTTEACVCFLLGLMLRPQRTSLSLPR